VQNCTARDARDAGPTSCTLGRLWRTVRAMAVPVGPRPRVLICEEDASLGALLEGVLRDEGYAPAVVRTQEDALAALARGGFAAVLTDCLAPVLQGIDAAVVGALVRAAAPAPVLLCTDRWLPPETDAAALGVAAVVPKPFDLPDLLAAVDAAVRGRGVDR
jgi:DNA-binding response OmpR family regulator